jgi:LDH2 family malate/lactate/ureidoglycolate dehydrogenase
VLAVSPSLFGSEEEFGAQVTQYADAVRRARPVEGGEGARMPFDRSRADRRRRQDEGAIEVAEPVHAALVSLAGSAPQAKR